MSDGRVDEVGSLESQRQAVRERMQALRVAVATNVTALSPELAALLRGLSAAATAADQAVQLAVRESGAESVSGFLGRGGWINPAEEARLLAEPWDRDKDVLLLVGVGAARLAPRFQSLGQRRIVTVDPGHPATPDDVREARKGGQTSPSLFNLPSLELLELAGRRLEEPRPDQMRAFVCSPEAPASAEAIAAALQRGLFIAAYTRHELGATLPYCAQMSVRNLERLASLPTAGTLRGALQGLPAVVVAAGPSLDRNIQQLRTLNGRAVVIAMNQTVRALVRAGIQPDIVVVIDPLKVTYHFEDLPPGSLRTLILGAAVDPSLFALPAERIFSFSSSPVADGWLYELLGDSALLGSDGTVSNAALRLAVWMGCSPVVSVGRDMALDGKRYYADSSADGGEGVKILEDGSISFADSTSKLRLIGSEAMDIKLMLASQEYRVCQVPGFFGKPVTTTELFVYEIGLLRQTLRELKGQAHFINATEGGAYLEGMEHMTLAGFIERCPPDRTDIQGRLAAAQAAHDPAAARKRMEQGLRPLFADLDSVVKSASRAEALVKRPGRSGAYERERRKLLERARKRLLISAMVQGALSDLTADELPLYRAIQDNIGPLVRGIAEQLPKLAASNPDQRG